MTDFDVRLYGAARRTARFVALWWDERSIPPGHEVGLRPLLKDVPSASGVYAITGRHYAHPGGGVLYVGQASRLKERVLKSAEGRLHERSGDGVVQMSADVWDLTIRWARLSSSLVDSVERLLIMSHCRPSTLSRYPTESEALVRGLRSETWSS